MIPLGFELGSGKRVSVPLGHMIVLGQTQKSGKTTTLEALTDRSGVCAVAFITKRGEKSFRLAHTIPPFYSETSATQPYWKFVISLIESMQDIKLGMRERGYVMDLCRDSSIEKTVTNDKGKKKKEKHSWQEPETLADVLANAELAMEHSKGINRMICLQLVEYLRIAVPEIQRAKLSNTIELRRGINVMDLSKLSTDVQALIVRSVVEWVYLHRKNTVVIIPEAWKFLPENHATPVLAPVMSLIRQGAVIGNFVWIDLQDLRGIKKEILRSIQVWLFGVQREKNEIENTLKSMPVPEAKPTAADMMSLRIGQFIVAHDDEIRRVYVQPAGMEDAHAQAIARGEEKPESWPQILRSLAETAIPEPERDQHSADAASDERLAAPDAEPSNGSELRASVAGMEGENDEMWKEKYDKLIADFSGALHCENSELAVAGAMGDLLMAHDSLAKRVELLEGKNSPSQSSTQRSAETHGAAAASTVSPAVAPSKNGFCGEECSAPDLEKQIRAVFLRMAAQDAPTAKTIAQLFQTSPELEIKRQVRRVQMTDDTTQGRVAILLHEGFFETEKDQGAVLREFKRRGWFDTKASNTALIKPLAQLTEWGFFVKGDAGLLAVPNMKVNVTKVISA